MHIKLLDDTQRKAKNVRFYAEKLESCCWASLATHKGRWPRRCANAEGSRTKESRRTQTCITNVLNTWLRNRRERSDDCCDLWKFSRWKNTFFYFFVCLPEISLFCLVSCCDRSSSSGWKSTVFHDPFLFFVLQRSLYFGAFNAAPKHKPLFFHFSCFRRFYTLNFR